jgi:hypothetical protein
MEIHEFHMVSGSRNGKIWKPQMTSFMVKGSQHPQRGCRAGWTWWSWWDLVPERSFFDKKLGKDMKKP